MTLPEFVHAVPKVELHVHLEGSIRPETLLKLARRHDVRLPSTNVERLREWYQFSGFGHFIEVYQTISRCLRTADDIELITREFLAGQAAQNIRHSDVTYTAFSQWRANGIPFSEQLAAINRARAWGAGVLGVSMLLVLDIARDISAEDGALVAEWGISGLGNGVAGLGLAGPETAAEPMKFRHAFERGLSAGLRSLPHAGEIAGPASIWGALRDLRAERIGHGVRCLEDEALVAELAARQIPLEVCPSSNVCLKVANSWQEHPLPRLIERGLYVTLNSDDPPLFNTTLSDEYLHAVEVFGFDLEQLQRLSLAALRACCLEAGARAQLEAEFLAEWARLREEHGV